MSTGPGSNPNKTRAIQPKDTWIKNEPRSETESSFLKWVDPIKEPFDVSNVGIYNSTKDDEFQAEFTLDMGYFDPIVDGVNEVVLQLAYQSNVSAQQANDVGEMLRVLAPLKAVKRLYSTATTAEKSEILKLKGMYYDTSPVPTPVQMAIEIIGSFKSKLGRFHVKYLTDVAARLTAKAINVAHAWDPIRFPREIIDLDTLFWPVDGSLLKLQDELKSELRSYSADVYVNGFATTIGLPPFNEDTNWNDYRRLLNDVTDPTGYFRSACDILGMSSALQLSRQSLRDVNRRFADGNNSIDAMGVYAATALLPVFARKYQRILERFFDLRDVSTDSDGSEAQLVSANDDFSSTEFIPLSAAGMSTGWLLCPSTDISYSMTSHVENKTGKSRSAVVATVQYLGARPAV